MNRKSLACISVSSLLALATQTAAADFSETPVIESFPIYSLTTWVNFEIAYDPIPSFALEPFVLEPFPTYSIAIWVDSEPDYGISIFEVPRIIHSTLLEPVFEVWGGRMIEQTPMGVVNEPSVIDSPMGNMYVLSTGIISVNTVPEPATLWLFGSVFAGFATFGKRRQNR